MVAEEGSSYKALTLNTTRQTEVSTPDSAPSSSSSRGKETKICGFEVLQDVRTASRGESPRQAELSVTGSGLLSKQLRSPTPPTPVNKTPKLRIRTPRRTFAKQNVHFPKEFIDVNNLTEAERKKIDHGNRKSSMETQVGALLITSL